jgi:predicted nucleic acid-binding protein
VAILYLDTSALVKLYVEETGSDKLVALTTDSARHQMAVLALARVEFRSAVRRRQRAGDFDASSADALIASLTQHLQDLFIVQPVTETTLEEAQSLIDAHALRAFDAVQLAGARVLVQNGVEALVFVCSDLQLCSVAAKQGLRTFNPEVDDAAVVGRAGD